MLPGATEAEWRQYGDAWVDTRELAWIAAECLVRPLGAAANVINSHFIWHDVYATLIHETGSNSRIRHKDFDAITDDELPRKLIYAQTWRFSGELLAQQLDFRPSYDWRATLAEVARLEPSTAGEEKQ